MTKITHSLITTQQQQLHLSASLACAISLTEMTGYEIMSFLEKEALSNPLIEIMPPQYAENDYPAVRYKKNDIFFISDCVESKEVKQELSLYDHVLQQLMLEYVSEKEIRVIQLLLAYMDNAGYIRTSLQDISIETHLTLLDLTVALKKIQSLDPAGIGARDLAECFILQLQRLPKPPVSAIEILTKYPRDFFLKKFHLISEKSNISIEKLVAVYDFLKKLFPHPGKIYDQDKVTYIAPDLVMSVENYKIQIKYLTNTLPSIIFNEGAYVYYKKIQDPHLKSFIDMNYNHYKMLASALLLRQKTLILITEEIFRVQLPSLLKKSPTLTKLTQQEIAQNCHLSISTVSRAIRNKYVQTKDGIIPLKNFLDKGCFKQNTTLADLSAKQIQQTLVSLIEHEDKTSPYSDYKLEKIFAELQIPISRRTITKYRAKLKIPDSILRKQIKKSQPLITGSLALQE